MLLMTLPFVCFSVVSQTRYLSDNVVHLFLQSPLSIEAIDGVIKQPQGQSVATIITEHAQQAQG